MRKRKYVRRRTRVNVAWRRKNREEAKESLNALFKSIVCAQLVCSVTQGLLTVQFNADKINAPKFAKKVRKIYNAVCREFKIKGYK